MSERQYIDDELAHMINDSKVVVRYGSLKCLYDIASKNLKDYDNDIRTVNLLNHIHRLEEELTNSFKFCEKNAFLFRVIVGLVVVIFGLLGIISWLIFK